MVATLVPAFCMPIMSIRFGAAHFAQSRHHHAGRRHWQERAYACCGSIFNAALWQ